MRYFRVIFGDYVSDPITTWTDATDWARLLYLSDDCVTRY